MGKQGSTLFENISKEESGQRPIRACGSDDCRHRRRFAAPYDDHDLGIGGSSWAAKRCTCDVAEDDILVFQVEKKTYKVSRNLLVRNSCLFADLLSLPQQGSADGVLEGASKEHPIVLEGIHRAEWEILLLALYDLNPEFTLPQRHTLLSISHRLQFQTVFLKTLQDLCSCSLNLISPIERLVLLDTHALDLSDSQLSSLRDPIIKELASRPYGLSDAETMRISRPVQIMILDQRNYGWQPIDEKYLRDFSDFPINGLGMGVGEASYREQHRHSVTRSERAVKPYLKDSPKDKAKRVLRDVTMTVTGRKFTLTCLSGSKEGKPRSGTF